MFSHLSGRGYVVWIVLSFACLGATVVFFPHLLRWLVLAMAKGHCSGGVCGALAAVLGVYLKLAVILIAALLVGVATWRRVRGRLSLWWIGFAMATLWGAGGFLFAAGNFWGANFAVGLLKPALPWSLIALLTLTAVMARDIEATPGFDGRIRTLAGPFALPIGLLYVATSLWVSIIVLIVPVTSLIGHGATALFLSAATGLHRIGLFWLLSLPVAVIANLVAGLALFVGLSIIRRTDRGRRVEGSPSA